ncbi:nuclear transport factor 2 family protein [Thermosynechococcaceae cyanobacterium BACA0444]|uniref:Nuclear transport factor 2 family protein n=1 Tax=Pseudocalidococcus azoricus BACA0444 TaxID=2918990 RepID=A0AAE4FRJ1_9CYAN|nr:nuclear transport factor 2 family protein [Pseudocalidococcus azoricus]MDS3860821.1 nuclear transport factor 2 family protein [Pseudocalidococcus azoricus BACA0444]
MTALLELNAEQLLEELPQLLNESQISETISAYFAALNAEAYADIVALFAADGMLFPPFEDAVVGPKAISHYLQAEAVGMRAIPATYQLIRTNNSTNEQRVLVRGSVQLPLFNVNVAWDFCLTVSGKIKSVRVNLLASLEELVKFRSQ